jgi:hypothetical protein
LKYLVSIVNRRLIEGDIALFAFIYDFDGKCLKGRFLLASEEVRAFSSRFQNRFFVSVGYECELK